MISILTAEYIGIPEGNSAVLALLNRITVKRGRGKLKLV